jgi:hypothetical protein
MTKSTTQIRTMSAPVSFTIPPTIVSPVSAEEHRLLGPTDPETQWRASVQRQLDTIQNLLKPAVPATNFTRVIEQLIQWIATRSISFSAIECSMFRNFCELLNPLFTLPCHRKLMRIISKFANFTISFPARADRAYCSLMLDGASKFDHQFLAVILFCEYRIHFLELLDLPDQKSKTIASRVAPIIQKLATNNLIVTGICSDNASNEKAILNPAHDYSLQQHTGLPILRLPCTAHTANLALRDILTAPQPGSSPPVLELIQHVIHALPLGLNTPFHKIPRITETRWLSYGKTVMFLVQHYRAVERFLSEKGLESCLRSFKQLQIRDLAIVLSIISDFIVQAEANYCVYSDVFPAFAETIAQLERFSDNKYSRTAINCLFQRFSSTADFSHIVITFLLTPAGHAHFRRCVDRSPYQQFLREWAAQGLQSISTIFHLDQVNLIEMFEYYLWKMEIPEISTSELWAKFPPFLPIYGPKNQQEEALRNSNVFTPESGCTSTAGLVEVGQRMAVFPASECACERLFCNIRNLVGDYRHSMSTETLRNLLRIRMNKIWNDGQNDIESVATRLQDASESGFSGATPISQPE